MTEDVLVNNHFHYFEENRGDRDMSLIGDLRRVTFFRNRCNSGYFPAFGEYARIIGELE